MLGVTRGWLDDTIERSGNGVNVYSTVVPFVTGANKNVLRGWVSRPLDCIMC
jgi:hypothetical protein